MALYLISLTYYTFNDWIDTFVDGSSLCTAAGGSMVSGWLAQPSLVV